MPVDLNSIQKILVIKLRAIGDVLLSTVVLNNLRAAFPHARIDFCTETPSREIVEGHPAVDSVLVFDPPTESGAGLIGRVRKEKYDCVIDLFGNPRSAIMTLMSGARYRVGYRFGWRRFCYSIVAEPRGHLIHNRDFNLDALRMLGIPVQDTTLMIAIPDTARKFADEFFRNGNLEGKRVVAINAGGGWYTKRWGIGHFASLADTLVEQFQAQIVICWGPGEKEKAEELQRTMKHPSRLIPPSTLKELAALLSRCSAMVTNDSGPMHIAGVMGTPVLAVFGPTNPQFQGPVGSTSVIVRNERLDCLGCNLTKCPIGLPCMKKLEVEEVLSGFRILMTDLNKGGRDTTGNGQLPAGTIPG